MRPAQRDARDDVLEWVRIAIQAIDTWRAGQPRAAIQLIRSMPFGELADSHPAIALLRGHPALYAAARGDVEGAHRCLGRALAERLARRLEERPASGSRPWRGPRLPWARTLVMAATAR